MSAPDTNVDKQRKNHRPALRGILGVVAFAGILLAGLVGWTVLQSDGPEGAADQTELGPTYLGSN